MLTEKPKETCESDNDCKLTCECSCISKNSNCAYRGYACEPPSEFAKCKCINNKCEEKWEKTVELCETENPSFDYNVECSKKLDEIKSILKNCTYGLGPTKWLPLGSCRNCTITCD